MARSTREAARDLHALASSQGGYFTTKQAIEAGYGYRHLDYHETAGNFERVEHGLYRLPTVPPSEHDDLIRLSLWSRNQKDEPQAVVSHESALVLHELTELLPGQIHLTVPPTFRKAAPTGCVLHKATLAEEEIEERAGFRVTTPLRTLLDAADAGSEPEQLEKAVADALARGLVRREDDRVRRQGLGTSRAGPRRPEAETVRKDAMAKKFTSAAAFKSSLEARLRTRAQELSIPFQTLQLKFVMERLLARLFREADAPWLLKGGFAMDLRFRPRARTTKDVDLSVEAPGGQHRRRPPASDSRRRRPSTSATSSPTASASRRRS